MEHVPLTTAAGGRAPSNERERIAADGHGFDRRRERTTVAVAGVHLLFLCPFHLLFTYYLPVVLTINAFTMDTTYNPCLMAFTIVFKAIALLTVTSFVIYLCIVV